MHLKGIPLSLQLQLAQRRCHSVWQQRFGMRADSHTAHRGLALDAGRDVDGVAHDRVRTAALGTQQTDRYWSRVDPDPEQRPVRMLLGKA